MTVAQVKRIRIYAYKIMLVKYQFYLTLVPCAHVLITFLQITVSLIINTALLVIQYGIISSLVLYQAVHFHMIYMHTFLRMTIGIKIKADKNVLQSRIRTTSLLGISLISNAQLHYSCLKIIQLPNTTEGGLKKSLSTDEAANWTVTFYFKRMLLNKLTKIQQTQQREGEIPLRALFYTQEIHPVNMPIPTK